MVFMAVRSTWFLVGLSLVVAGCKRDEPAPSSRPPGAPVVDAGGAGLRDGGAGVAPGFVPRDVNHVLATGQSLSVALGGDPPLSKDQPYFNLMFNTGVMAEADGLTSFVPLVESDVVPGSSGPVVETMSSGFANLVARMAREELGGTAHDLLVSVHGVNATAYSGLKKGTEPYRIGIAQVTAGNAIATQLGKTYVVRAVTTVHGESDHIAVNAEYAANLAEWQTSYEADVQAITKQTEPVPLFESQISNWTKFGQATSAIPALQLAAHLARGRKVVLIGPKYQLAHHPDGIHLTNEGYRQMGEEYAKAYRRVVLEGRPWEPLRPETITRSGALITIKFVVPAPPLVLDTTTVSDPGANGFELTDASGGPRGIAEVKVTGPDTVTVRLSAAPPAGGGRLRYAHTGAIDAAGGPRSGPRGNLRDSDATPSRSGRLLHNWCVHFDEAVP
jgi:hypothetical protein